MRWIYDTHSPEEITALSRHAGVSPVLAELLIRGGITDPADATRFLQSSLSDLQDPFLLPGVEPAAQRLVRAIHAREDIAVLGDYDVDGVTSTALFVGLLRRFGLSPHFVVPRRMADGYGLSRSAIDRALELRKPSLFVALDCGTNSHEEVAHLRAQGIDVIVVDHHRSKDKPLDQGILINPHVHEQQEGVESPWHHLCTVGLVFKLGHGLLKLLRNENHPEALKIKLRDYLDLVALGTIADLVPLRGENRILARQGLKTLQSAARPGVQALMEIAGVNPAHGILPVDISFRLGPRINASGRLADAALSVELFLSDDETFCEETARQLDVFNRERQDIERLITEDAERMVEQQFKSDPGIVLFNDAWHPGVVGIVAGRITRKYNRPCVVLGNENGLAKGSGRSINGLSLVEALAPCSEHLTTWGGHPMAVGVALAPEKVAAFRASFCASISKQTGGALDDATLALAVWLTPDQVRDALLDEISALHPFGQGNPEPIFGIRGVVLRQRPEVFKGTHFRFTFDDTRGRRLFGVAWKMADRLPPVGQPIDLAVELGWNHFNDRKLLQLELIDWRLSPKE